MPLGTFPQRIPYGTYQTATFIVHG